MSMHGAIGFKNNNGRTYEFKIYPMDAHFKPEHGGVYVITKCHDDAQKHHCHHVVFVGKTGDLAAEMADHPSKALFESENANCCCVHATQDAAARDTIAGELQAKYLS
jgi:hypothetical protein